MACLEADGRLTCCTSAVAKGASSILQGAPENGDRTHAPLSRAAHAHSLTRASQTECECGPACHRRAATLGGRGERAADVLPWAQKGAVVGVAPVTASRSRRLACGAVGIGRVWSTHTDASLSVQRGPAACFGAWCAWDLCWGKVLWPCLATRGRVRPSVEASAPPHHLLDT